MSKLIRLHALHYFGAQEMKLKSNFALLHIFLITLGQLRTHISQVHNNIQRIRCWLAEKALVDSRGSCIARGREAGHKLLWLAACYGSSRSRARCTGYARRAGSLHRWYSHARARKERAHHKVNA